MKKFKHFCVSLLALYLSLGGITYGLPFGAGDVGLPSGTVINTKNIGLFSGTPVIDDISVLADEYQNLDEIIADLQIVLETKETSQAHYKKILDSLDHKNELLTKRITNLEEDIGSLENEIGFYESQVQTLNTRQSALIKQYLTMIQIATLLPFDSLANKGLLESLLARTLDTESTIIGPKRVLKNAISTLGEQNQHLTKTLREYQITLGMQKAKREKIVFSLESTQNITTLIGETKELLTGANISEQRISRKIAGYTAKRAEIESSLEAKFVDYEHTLQGKLDALACDTNTSSQKCQWIKRYVGAEKDLAKSGMTLSAWLLPTAVNNGFGWLFRDQKHYVKFETHHEGLDILLSPGTPVQSIEKGYIIAKQFPRNGMPGMVIVKHPNTYISIYLGIVPASLELFTHVSAGDTIGTMDTYMEDGNPNALHLELFHRGKQVDPLEYISLADISPTNIPSRYGWKFIDDRKKSGREIDLGLLKSTIQFFAVPGASEIERQKSLLDKYAADDYDDVTPWIEESLGQSIDPSFTICVGFAESTLGNALTTDDNVGNVGNTDSGARRSYDGARNGIRAIGAVLNNNFLGGYSTIDELSGWGNSEGPIYASSRTNWHENIIKCLSALKGRYVGNTAPFRLTRAALLRYERAGYKAKDSTVVIRD